MTVRSNRGISCTSTAMRPVSGIRVATPRLGSSVPSGSISITISRPGCTISPGICALADVIEEDRVPNVGEVSRVLGVSRSQVYRMLNEGTIPPRVQVSDKRRGWLRSDLFDWLRSHRETR